MAQTELEVRWQAWKRWSLVGFAGAGVARADGLGSSRDQSVFTGGGGFRYEIARQYGLHMGLDLAAGPHETAVYVVFGSAWFSP